MSSQEAIDKETITLRFFVKETSNSLVRLRLNAAFPGEESPFDPETAFRVSVEVSKQFLHYAYFSTYQSQIKRELYARFGSLVPISDDPSLEHIIVRDINRFCPDSSKTRSFVEILVTIRPFWKSYEWPSEETVKEQGTLFVHPEFVPHDGERIGRKICKGNISFVFTEHFSSDIEFYNKGYFCFEKNAFKNAKRKRLNRQRKQAIRDTANGRFIGLKSFVRNVVWRSGLDKSYYLNFDERTLRGIEIAVFYMKVFKTWLPYVKTKKARGKELYYVLRPFLKDDCDLAEYVKVWANFKLTKFKDKRRRLIVRFAKAVKNLHREIKNDQVA